MSKIISGRQIPVKDIKVGIRRREDMGDIQGLADSMKRYGLLHSIVVDDEWNLVAGGRRLEAARLLGWDMIDVRFATELSEKEMRVLELEENIRRKDLTEYEKSKDMVELVQAVKEQIKEEFACANSAQAPTNIKGITVPGSYRDISQRIGIPQSTIRAAEKHVQVVEKYPDLKTFPKDNAIKVAQKLDEMSPPIREAKLQEIRENNEKHEENRKQIDEIYRIKNLIDDAVSKAARLKIDEERLNIWIDDCRREDIEFKNLQINDAIKNLYTLQSFLNGRLSKPILIKGVK